MATEEKALDQAQPPETELDEASIISSLARLKELHIMLRDLRETIPKVMDSVLAQPLSPGQMHSNFSQAANTAAQAIKHFTQLVEDDRTKEVMQKAKKSRTENNEGITAWQVTEHEDWLDAKKENETEDVDDKDRDLAETEDSPGLNDVKAVLDKFRSSHVGIEVSLDEDSRTVTLSLPLPAHIKFQIQLDSALEDRNNYVVDSEGKSSFNRAIVEAIRARTNSNDLNYLLEMLASYSDVKSRPCVKCSRLLDRNAQFPVLRSRKKTKQPDGRNAIQWLALHTACT